MKRARGQAMVEYVLLISMSAAMLFTPLPAAMLPPGAITTVGGSMSMFGLFVRVFDIYINSYQTVITLPIP